jgi:two-component system LytT family response regulator
MDKIRTLIVDDEPLARQRLRTLLATAPDFEVIGECGDGAEAIAAISERAPELVFLDVQMPGLDGMAVIEELGPERAPAFIFVTAYDRYALQAFEVQALDYLLKPFDRERFTKALDRARAAVRREPTADNGTQLRALIEEIVPARKYQDRVMIKSGNRVVFLKVEEIDWVEAAGNYLRLHVGRETHLLRETMSALEARLDPAKFLRIHRSTIVNIDRIQEFHPLFHGDYAVLLNDGTQLTLSRGYRQKLPAPFGEAL